MQVKIPEKWLLLIHQIPPKPNAFRVKIWRRLQQIGSISIKQSVYAMPFSNESREDFGWILKEIMDGGGDASILEARFIEGLTDEQVVGLFQSARKTDYEKIIADAASLQSDLKLLETDGTLLLKKATSVSRLKARFEEIIDVDFFNAPERGTAEILLKDLSNMVTGTRRAVVTSDNDPAKLKGKTWVTRQNIFVDRMACGWLIRRFINPGATFLFMSGDNHSPGPDEIRFDMHGGEYTHEGDKCSFEVMVEKFCTQDKAAALLAELVHDIDLKESKFGHGQTEGFKALLRGITSSETDDNTRMDQGIIIFEHMYAFFHRHSN
ncbi:MAG: chromate resistance protein ChrB domain-containing protein [Pseudomonadota bacterium]